MADDGAKPVPPQTADNDEIEVGIHVIASTVRKSSDEVISAGQAQPDDGEVSWGGAVVLNPPLPPERLLALYGVSDVLHQCVDAMVQNVDGYGWVPEPVLDLDADDARDQVAVALALSDLAGAPAGTLPEPPDEAEVEATLVKWQRRAIQEKAIMQVYFDGLCFEGSFIDLRKQRTVDAEVIGWAGWEVIRNSSGTVVRLRHIPAQTMRLSEPGEDPVTVQATRPTSLVTTEGIPVERFFRIIVQLDDKSSAIYFKEWSDPRIFSSKTGKLYATEAALDKDEKGVPAANEVLWFENYHPGSAYGQPRWHGLIPSIIGNRLVQDINVEFLDDSAIPRGLLLVSDGRIGKSSRKKLDTFFEEKKGQAHNRIALIEAVTPKENAILEGSGRVQIQWIPLRDAQRDDATFSKYAEQNADKVGETFRIPPLLRGKVKDLNRATAVASIEYAEQQVFAPERAEFDSTINRTLVADLGIRFWRFKSRGPRTHDPETQAKNAEVMLKNGVVSPAELRKMVPHILGVDLQQPAQPWQRYTQSMILAGHVPPGQRAAMTPGAGVEPPPGEEAAGDGQEAAEKSDIGSIARAILQMKARLEIAKAAEHAAAMLELEDANVTG